MVSEPVGNSSSLVGLIETNVKAAMQGHNASMLVRMPFEVDDPNLYTSLTLRMKYDDGYVAYLNGVEVARRNAPATPSWNSAATAQRTDAQASTWEDVNISADIDQLVVGTNVLAIQAMNSSAADGDFLVLPELAQVFYLGFGEHFFAQATPGVANVEEYWLYVEDTNFSEDRGFYDAPFYVQVTTDTPGANLLHDRRHPAQPNQWHALHRADPGRPDDGSARWRYKDRCAPTTSTRRPTSSSTT